MLRRIRYFQAVVRNSSFSEAAEECHISQSAISQQIKALETELGFALLERKNRRFSLTPAGELFYRKSLILVADCDQLCRDCAALARGGNPVLRIGYLRDDPGLEIRRALDAFAVRCPQVSVRLLCGNHEELFQLLLGGGADLVVNDQRRAFSEEYVNLVLDAAPMAVELPARNPLSALPSVSPRELKSLPCILVAAREQQAAEADYYRSVIGFSGEFLFAATPEEARLMVASGQGFLPVAGRSRDAAPDAALCPIPLYRGEEPILRRLCLFWKKGHDAPGLETFARLLGEEFSPSGPEQKR